MTDERSETPAPLTDAKVTEINDSCLGYQLFFESTPKPNASLKTSDIELAKEQIQRFAAELRAAGW